MMTRPAPTDDEVVVSSADGALIFSMRRTPKGVCVQRQRHRRDKRSRLLQTNVFLQTAPFERWIDADSVRFDYPILYSEVRRRGVALLVSHEQPDSGAATR